MTLSAATTDTCADAVLVEGDVAEKRPSRRAVGAATDKFGRLDALVSNAGIMVRKPLRLLTLAEWHKVLDTNLTATFLFARAADEAAAFREGRHRDHRVDVGADVRAEYRILLGIQGRPPGVTHALAISLGPDVRVNCVSPGWIVINPAEKLRRKDHLQHPVGRAGRPQDIAEIVAFLLDGKRAGFITGANFIVDGGMTRKMIYEE